MAVNRWVSRLDEDSNGFVTSDSNACRRKNDSCCPHGGLLLQVGKDLVCSQGCLYSRLSLQVRK